MPRFLRSGWAQKWTWAAGTEDYKLNFTTVAWIENFISFFIFESNIPLMPEYTLSPAFHCMFTYSWASKPFKLYNNDSKQLSCTQKECNSGSENEITLTAGEPEQNADKWSILSTLCFITLLTQAWLQASACWCSPSQVLSLETETLHTGPVSTPSNHTQAETQKQDIRFTNTYVVYW